MDIMGPFIRKLGELSQGMSENLHSKGTAIASLQATAHDRQLIFIIYIILILFPLAVAKTH
jgi:hypothetical protein